MGYGGGAPHKDAAIDAGVVFLALVAVVLLKALIRAL